MAEIIVKSVAKVGIISLVDEATGYQEIRARKALEIIVNKFIDKEFSAWTKRFPDEFFKEIFRLKKWQYIASKIKKPQVIGHYINDIVYSRMAPGILEELKKINPERKVKHHQFLTQNIGHPRLTEHIYALLGLMRMSNSWSNFLINLDKAYPNQKDPFFLFHD